MYDIFPENGLSIHLLVPMNNEQMTAMIQEKALIQPK